MKTFLVLAVILAVIGTSFSQLMHSPSTHKDYPNQCYVESHETGYSVGKHNPIGHCVEVLCLEDFSYQMLLCDPPRIPEGHHTVTDSSKPFPGCCPQIVKD